jgi:hypothetical protein
VYDSTRGSSSHGSHADVIVEWTERLCCAVCFTVASGFLLCSNFLLLALLLLLLLHLLLLLLHPLHRCGPRR